MNSYQTFQSITVIWRHILGLSEFFEFFFHCPHSGLHVELQSAAGEDVGVDLRVGEDPLPGALGHHLTDVPVSPGVVGGGLSPHAPLGGQRGQAGVVHGGLVPLVVAVHRPVQRGGLGGVGARGAGAGRGLQARVRGAARPRPGETPGDGGG